MYIYQITHILRVLILQPISKLSKFSSVQKEFFKDVKLAGRRYLYYYPIFKAKNQ